MVGKMGFNFADLLSGKTNPMEMMGKMRANMASDPEMA